MHETAQALPDIPGGALPRVASYITTFLKPEMHHIYRQVANLHTFETFVITKTRQNAETFPFNDVEIIPPARSFFDRRRLLEKHLLRKSPFFYRGEYAATLEILRRRKPDLLHVYFGHTAVSLLPLLLDIPIPVVVSFHGMDTRLRPCPNYQAGLEKVFRRADLILVRSNSLGQRLIAMGCSPEKIRPNRTGVPLEKFPWTDRVPPPDGRWKLVQACRFVEKKGLFDTLAAFRELRKGFPLAELVLAGDGPLRGPLEQKIGELGLAHCVKIIEFQKQHQLSALFQGAHVFVHPSKLTEDGNCEGIPNVILEAMASGLPVAATRHGGIPELLAQGENGWLVAEGDVAGLAEALGRILRDYGGALEMAHRGRGQLLESFAHGTQIRSLEASYTEAVGRRKSNTSLATL